MRLALVMIVKNEAHGIAATLVSARPWIDRWTIVDTGSTDGTPEIVRATLGDVPGELHAAPFVDFATTRNLALDLAARTDATHALLLNGDDRCAGDGATLRAFVAAHAADAFSLPVHDGALRYDHARVVRLAAGWRYVGVTHEVILGPRREIAEVRAPGHVVHAPPADEDRAARWALDLALLTDAAARDPRDTRTVFYRAQTLDCLGRHAEAAAEYDRRAAMGGWFEEHAMALYRAGGCVERGGGPWPDAQARYLDAYARDPRRAEPLQALAWHYNAARQHALAWLFARPAAALPYPADATLFVEPDVYAWKAHSAASVAAYHVGERALAVHHARRALAGNTTHPQLVANLDHCLRAIGERV